MSALADIRTIARLAFTSKRGDTHAARLENFYAGQANQYDEFRKKLLHGREAAISHMAFAPGSRVVDIGGGTGNNLDALSAEQISNVAHWDLVDLCPSLLQVADHKIKSRSLDFAVTHEADACTWKPDEPADAVLFSYSATMIPDWLSAFENAFQMLKPGGKILVVDFYVARKFPTGTSRHGTFTRHFWPLWFSWDNVFLNPDHLPWLQSKYQTLHLVESTGALPYLPFAKVPYFYFVGRKDNHN